MGRPSKQVDINDIFKKVINLVKQGITIEKALESLKVDRSLFYRRASEQMKAELRELKTSKAVFSQPYTKGTIVSGDLLQLNKTVMDRFVDCEEE